MYKRQVAQATLVNAQGGEPVKVRVETTDSGFRCASGNSPNCVGDQNGDFIIAVDQGQLVELTFAWAHVGYILEEHVIVLEGYKLESDKINSQNREFTLKFVADKAGTFKIYCKTCWDGPFGQQHPAITATLIVK